MNEIAQELTLALEEIIYNLRWQVVVAIVIYTVIQIIFAIAIVNYAAAKNAEVFDYDKLAKKIAKEIKANRTGAAPEQ